MTRVAMVGRAGVLKRLAQELPLRDSSLEVVGLPTPEQTDDAEVVVGWNLHDGTLAHFPRVRLVHSPAAGCDHLLGDTSLPGNVPICRVVDPAQREGMTAFVSWAVLHYQRRLDEVLRNECDHHWEMPVQLPLSDTQVGVLGLGQFGGHAASQLARLGLSVRGWARSPRQLEGVECFHGNSQLGSFLEGLDILICLLPLTPETQGILNISLFRQMAPGGVVINLGRGPHLVVDDLLQALDEGHLRAALLDVFDQEPLPQDSALWSDPRVTVTPHMASAACIEAMVEQIVANIQRLEKGEPLINQVDRTGGY